MNRSNPRRRTVPETERLPRVAEKSSWPSKALLQEPNFSTESDRIQPRRPQPRRSPLQERPKSALSGSRNRGTPNRLERSSGNRRVGEDPGTKFPRGRRLGGNFSALGLRGATVSLVRGEVCRPVTAPALDAALIAAVVGISGTPRRQGDSSPGATAWRLRDGVDGDKLSGGAVTGSVTRAPVRAPFPGPACLDSFAFGQFRLHMKIIKPCLSKVFKILCILNFFITRLTMYYINKTTVTNK
jgi:hypothetical protein